MKVTSTSEKGKEGAPSLVLTGIAKPNFSQNRPQKLIKRSSPQILVF